MQRVFTQHVGRFRRGDVRDYPSTLWREIARSANLPLDRITRPVDEAVAEMVPGGGKRK